MFLEGTYFTWLLKLKGGSQAFLHFFLCFSVNINEAKLGMNIISMVFPTHIFNMIYKLIIIKFMFNDLIFKRTCIRPYNIFFLSTIFKFHVAENKTLILLCLRRSKAYVALWCKYYS